VYLLHNSSLLKTEVDQHCTVHTVKTITYFIAEPLTTQLTWYEWMKIVLGSFNCV